MSFHDEELGYLGRKETEAMTFEAEEMAYTNPAELPEESRFLFVMDGIKNSKKRFAYHDMNYWLGAMRAAKNANKKNFQCWEKNKQIKEKNEEITDEGCESLYKRCG